MFLKRAAQFFLQRRSHAMFAVLLLNVYPTFLSMLSAIIFAFVTLKKGAKEGLLLLPWAMLPSIAYAFGMHAASIFILPFVVWLLIWGCAVLLREYASWVFVIQTVMLLSILFVVGFHLVIGDVCGFWSSVFKSALQPLEATGMDVNAYLDQSHMQFLTTIATGLAATFFSTSVLVKLMIARGWQAKVENPGGLRKELHNIFLSRWVLVLLALLSVGVIVGSDSARDAIVPLLGAYVAAGLSLLHKTLVNYKFSLVLLILFYIVAVPFPEILFVVIVAAIIDSGLHFRSKRHKRGA